ncbi:SH3 domain-containing protein [Hoeflea sp.]|uniref:SH3 domain-containing protein n=1 Tax=Hoeflea sp. TaxID=1940281 RepID=UPI003A918F7C
MAFSIRSVLLVLSLTGFAALATGPASAGDCTGFVVGVKPINQYNHARGNGFLAVRTGPGSSYQQTGEVYRGDEVSVYDRRGNWYAITCMSGQCMRPLWGTPMPSGWVSRKYIDAAGVCP